jgi:membrane protein
MGPPGLARDALHKSTAATTPTQWSSVAAVFSCDAAGSHQQSVLAVFLRAGFGHEVVGKSVDIGLRRATTTAGVRKCDMTTQMDRDAGPSRMRRLLTLVGASLAGLLVTRLWSRRPAQRVSAPASQFSDQPTREARPAPNRDLPEPDANADTSDAPDPEDPSKPDSPADLSKPSILYVLRKTVREFGTDQCTDLAAALTYYAVLSLFPALVVVVSLLGVFGQGQRTTDAVLQIIDDLGPSSAVDALRDPIQQLVESPSAGFALVVGIGGALWSASGYVGAFGRAMNRIYEVEEGRPVWKLRPLQLLLTLVGLIAAAAVAFMLAVSGPVAKAIGDAIGAGEVAQTVWSVARWPIVLVFVVLAVAVLYHSSPNVKQPKFRWISVGAGVAILVWVVASLAFGFYVGNFGSYNKTYGALAGVIVFLLWLWITNLALLFGAELDAELERGRQLQAGIAAENDLQLPPRDNRVAEKNQAKELQDVERGHILRESRGREDG